jgi:hypothetical protein
MTTDQTRRKLELAVDREMGRRANGKEMESRAQRNLERGQRNFQQASDKVRHFQKLIRELDACTAAAERLP